MQLLKNCKFLLLIAALCAFSACSVGKNSSEADFLSFVENSPDCFCDSLAWESVCDGIDYAFYKNAEVPVRLHILKISLSERNLDLFAYPENNCTVLKGVSTKKLLKIKVPSLLLIRHLFLVACQILFLNGFFQKGEDW